MRLGLVSAIVGISLLAGCFPTLPDGNGKAAYTWNDQAVLNVGSQSLIGQITTIVGTDATGPSYYRQTQQFQVSNGYLTCSTPLNEKWGGGREGAFAGSSYSTDVSCSDGTTGRMQMTVSHWNGGGIANNGMKGLGTGRLSNGTRLRLTFGPSVNVTNTNF